MVLQNRVQSRRGHMMGSFLFGIVITAVLIVASMAVIQIQGRASTVESSGVALLAVGDRVQEALADVNRNVGNVPRSLAHERIQTGERCVEGICTTLEVTADQVAPDGRPGILVRVFAETSDNSEAHRSAYLVPLATNGEITGVDEFGRVEFVEGVAPGPNIDMWEIVSEVQ